MTWISLPRETRAKLAALFNIPRTGESVVRTGMITPQGNIGGESTSDGYAPKDLYAITIEKMQGLLGTRDTDFHKMFDAIVIEIDKPVPFEEPKGDAPVQPTANKKGQNKPVKKPAKRVAKKKRK